MTAREILDDEMSASTDKHIDSVPHLRGWILEAMERYAKQEVLKAFEAGMHYAKGIETFDNPAARYYQETHENK